MKDNLKVGTKEYYESELDRLTRSNLDTKAKKKIKEFLDYCENIGELSYNRLYFHAINLRILGEGMGERFLSPSENDVIQALTQQRRRNISEWTLEGYKATLKKFYSWLEMPEVVKNIKFKSKKKINYKKKPDWRITQEEVDLLIRSCNNARDKAILSLLYDSGIRLGELLTLKIKDVMFDNYGLRILVSGKTGVRNVRVIGDSLGYIKAWLNVHPDMFNQEAWLFCGIGHDIEGNLNIGSALYHQQIYAMFRKVKKRAVSLGFPENKRLNPHKFRHNRATELAPKLPPLILDKEMGWNLDSSMPAVYVHLNDEEVDNAYLEANGIHVEKLTKEARKTRTCLRCKTVNPSNSEYCLQCGSPLDYNKLKEVESKEKDIESTLLSSSVVDNGTKQLLKTFDPEFKDKILEAILSQIVNDPQLKEKFVKELASSQNR
ncbi:MAG: tyrosine-type recombinase/integrase [Thermoplasmatales archaeon]